MLRTWAEDGPSTRVMASSGNACETAAAAAGFAFLHISRVYVMRLDGRTDGRTAPTSPLAEQQHVLSCTKSPDPSHLSTYLLRSNRRTCLSCVLNVTSTKHSCTPRRIKFQRAQLTHRNFAVTLKSHKECTEQKQSIILN